MQHELQMLPGCSKQQHRTLTTAANLQQACACELLMQCSMRIPNGMHENCLAAVSTCNGGAAKLQNKIHVTQHELQMLLGCSKQ